jgi:hypothetical protein
MAKTETIRWLEAPEEHDYPAAFSYLCLTFPPTAADAMVKKLRKAKPAAFKAKDIFRASGLSLLGVSNKHVLKDQEKIHDRIAIAPLLLVRQPALARVIIADGYHRLCAVYSFDEDALIPCRIV